MRVVSAYLLVRGAAAQPLALGHPSGDAAGRAPSALR
jgi:hypothetical protein